MGDAHQANCQRGQTQDLQPALRQRRLTRKILGQYREIYSEPLLAPLHSGHADSSALLAMALNSQRARMTTVMSRISINSEVLRQQAHTSAEVVENTAEQLNRQVRETEQTAAASDETAKSSVELARLGGQLQQMVSHFRV